MLRGFAVVSLLIFISSFYSLPTSAQPAVSLDLAALSLRLDDIGQPGWVHLGAFVQSLDAEAADVAGYRGGGFLPDDVAAQMQSSGWQRSYVTVLGAPSTVNPTSPSQLIRSYVTEYINFTGAATGFAYLEDESNVPSAEDVPLDQSLGEEAEATRDWGSNQSGPFRSLDVTFRVGALVAGVTVVNSGTSAFTNPSLPEAERLAAILAARLAAVPPVGFSIGGAVLRLGGDGQIISTYDDAYYRLGEQDLALAAESSAATASRTASYADAVDVYQLWQGIDVTETAGVLYGVTLLRFPDVEAATTWVRDLPQVLGENPFYGNLEPFTAAALGDQMVGLTYVSGGGGPGDPQARLLAVRVGADVARVHLVPQGELMAVPPSALEEVTRMQVDCLRVLACPVVISVPPALEASLESPPATPVAVSPIAGTPAAE